MSFPSLWMWLSSERSVVCVNIHELGQIHSTSEILVNSNSKAWSNEHWVTSYMKIYIHIDNLNWYSLSMNIYGTTQNSTEKEGHPLFFKHSWIIQLYFTQQNNDVYLFCPWIWSLARGWQAQHVSVMRSWTSLLWAACCEPLPRWLIHRAVSLVAQLNSWSEPPFLSKWAPLPAGCLGFLRVW